MDTAIQVQAIGIGLFILSPVLLATASSSARIAFSRQRSFLGIVHSEDYLRALQRFCSLVAFLAGLLCFAVVYAKPVIPYIAVTIIAFGFVFGVYCTWRFSFRRR
jgi:hypothetical protein